MTLKSKLATLMLVGLMTTTSVASLAHAEAAAPAYATQTQMLRLSEEGRTALKSAQAARLELFNNNPEAAATEVETGIAALDAAAETLKTVVIPGTDAADAKAEYLPFDSSMALADTFVVTPEKQTVLDKVKGLFESKKQDEAIDVLRDGGVDVQVSTALLPGEATLKSLHDAAGMIKDGKYFEANVALKAIEDSVIVRSFGIDAIPLQGAAG